MNFTPAMNTGENYIVVGTNERGVHGAGAALEAKRHWGAIPGQGFGLMGHTFGIPTKDWQIQTLPLSVIAFYVARFKACARLRGDAKFLVTAVGTGLSGYKHEDIAPLFHGHSPNCTMPDEWQPFLV